MSKETQVQGFLNGYYGQQLLKEYTLDSYGKWRVFGEDPNFDLGGYHHNPKLGLFEGKLRDVIEYAVEQPQWGYGGKIEAYKEPKVIKLDSETLRRKAELEKRAAALEEELKSIRLQLKG
jgi:hypothetical protein